MTIISFNYIFGKPIKFSKQIEKTSELHHTQLYCQYKSKLNILFKDIQKCWKSGITLLVTVLIARVGEALPEIIHSIPKESESMLYGVEA